MGEESPPNDLETHGSDDDRSTFDEVLELLSDRYCRHVLVYLCANERTTVEELADVLIGIDAMDTDGIATPDDRERGLGKLHHVTLPKLEQADYLDVDDRTVVRTDLPEAICTHLQSPD